MLAQQSEGRAMKKELAFGRELDNMSISQGKNWFSPILTRQPTSISRDLVSMKARDPRGAHMLFARFS